MSDETRSLKMRKFHRQNLVNVVLLSDKCVCGSREFCDIAIHNGQSIRRDCAKCNRFRCFVRWYGRSTGAVADKIRTNNGQRTDPTVRQG